MTIRQSRSCERGRYEKSSEPAPTTYNTDGRFQCIQHDKKEHRGKMLEQILDKFNLLYLKKKKETTEHMMAANQQLT